MKFKKQLIFVLFLSTAAASFGQGMRMLELRGGFFNPKDAQSGLILGGIYGISFDERVSLGLGVDIFHKGYTKKTTIGETTTESGIVESTVQKLLEYNTTLVPLTLNLDIRFPLDPPVVWYVGGSLAYELLFNSENNYKDKIKEKRFYSGFGWMARIGIEYSIGQRSAVILETFYNNCRVSNNSEKKAGLPVWNEVNMSGFGFRGGIRLDFF